MVDSLVGLKLPAVVWLASTVIVVAHQGTPGTGRPVLLLAWLVFLAGVVSFLWHVTRTK